MNSKSKLLVTSSKLALPGILLGWDEQECEAYRVLNSSYHNLTIMSYDHVLERAKRMVGHDF